jgi:hypothetical protein
MGQPLPAPLPPGLLLPLRSLPARPPPGLPLPGPPPPIGNRRLDLFWHRLELASTRLDLPAGFDLAQLDAAFGSSSLPQLRSER